MSRNDDLEPLAPVIQAELAAELEEHVGQWVAVHLQQIVATGESVIDVVERAKGAGCTDPLVFRVPRGTSFKGDLNVDIARARTDVAFRERLRQRMEADKHIMARLTEDPPADLRGAGQ